MKTVSQSTILVIEDDSTMREGIQTVLEKEGYSVNSAADGFEGSRLFKILPPNLVITDLRLPDSSGMEVLKKLKEVSPETVGIVITGHGTVETAVDWAASEDVKILVLCHISDRYRIDEIVEAAREAGAQSGFRGELWVAYREQMIPVGSQS